MDFTKIKELDAKNYMNIFARNHVCFSHGEGCKLYDTYGNEYTDFFGGIATSCLGHNYPPLVNAIAEQAKKLIHISNLFYNEPQAKLGEALLSGTIFDRIFIGNSGAEANEAAIKLVRKYFYAAGKKKYKIVTALDSFHGRTLATLTATGQDKYSKPYAPLPQGFLHVPFNDFEALKTAINADDEIAAVMLECIQGESGVRPVDYEYLINAYALCKSKGLLLMLDEVQTGMGRTGKMFGFEHFGIQPDIITLAKGLGGGVPIGACLARNEIADAFKPGDHGTTFGGGPLACAAALVVVNELKNTDLLARVEKSGKYLSDRLMKLRKFKFVKDVRGMGLLQAIELSDKLKNAEVAGKMLSKGFIINAAGNNTLRFSPPYTITKAEIDAMAEALSELFAATNI
ncbi:MAG: aspartate aminotransferase family protein [Firmicutes bacterium]|nr:aspartate aminotransferase family protein [Bacillota bacterium]